MTGTMMRRIRRRPGGVRRHRLVTVPTALATALAGAALGAGAPAVAADPPAHTVQVSVRTGGFAPGNGSNGVTATTRLLSANGRYVVYAASGPVVPGQQQLSFQIVRRDRQLGTTTLISRSTGGAIGNGNSYDPSISADGQVVAFRSAASNLVPGDTNGTTDIFVHDVRTGRTTRASVTSAGAQVPIGQVAGDDVVGPPTISADGRWVGFTSRVSGYTSDDTTGVNAYLHDRITGTIEVVSRHAGGAVGSAHVSTAVVPSANGDLVAFQSLDDLVPGAANAKIDVFVRDRRAGQEGTTQVGGAEHRDLRQAMTPNGRYVVFDSADAVVPGDTNAKSDVFVHDRVTGTYERVSVSSAGAQGNGDSTHGSISDDGRYVTFLSAATNLVGGDTNATADVFRHDRQTGRTIRVNVHDRGAQATAASSGPAISGDGQHVAFNSYARLTTTATHGYQQVYVRDLAGRYPALLARIGALPRAAYPTLPRRIATRDIRTGPLVITWQPVGKPTTVRRTAKVAGNRFVLRAPKKRGKYTVTVSYADHVVRSRVVTVRRPGTKKLPRAVRAGRALRVRTLGVAPKRRVVVRFQPRDRSAGRALQRRARVNAKGVAVVRAPQRRGAYRVVVRGHGRVLRTAALTVR